MAGLRRAPRKRLASYELVRKHDGQNSVPYMHVLDVLPNNLRLLILGNLPLKSITKRGYDSSFIQAS